MSENCGLYINLLFQQVILVRFNMQIVAYFCGHDLLWAVVSMASLFQNVCHANLVSLVYLVQMRLSLVAA